MFNFLWFGYCAIEEYLMPRKRNPTYEYILEGLPPGLERSIVNILTAHVGGENRITRKALACLAIYGFMATSQLTDVDDRKVRLAISSLQSQGYPILSDSSDGGYWLGLPHEIDGYIAELESRREALAEKIRALRKSDKMLYVEKEPVVQTRLSGF